MRTLRIGSRGSKLALIQTRSIMARLRESAPELEMKLEIIETRGDRLSDRPLSRLGGSGVFIKEIENALFEERIDLAVHSMKDVPSTVPDELVLAATTERADPRDALVSRRAESIDALPEGAVLATGSLRRRSQLLARRPDLRIEELRGNVPTRLEKFDASSWDAIVLAAAGLMRLDLADRIRSLLPVEVLLPAMGQGALALEARADDGFVRDRVASLNHEPTASAVASERAFLERLEGGCQVPIAAYAEMRSEGEELRLRGYVGSADGAKHVRGERSGRASAAREIGLELAESLFQSGAREIVREMGGSHG